MKNVKYFKRRIIVSLVMDAIWIVLGFGGAFVILGSVGAIEMDNITILQGLIQCAFASVALYVAHIVFNISEAFKAKYINNTRVRFN